MKAQINTLMNESNDDRIVGTIFFFHFGEKKDIFLHLLSSEVGEVFSFLFSIFEKGKRVCFVYTSPYESIVGHFIGF